MAVIIEIIGIIGGVVSILAAAFNVHHTYTARTREQARRISAWLEDGKVLLSNESELPIYELIVSSVVIKKDKEPRDIEEAFAIVNSGTYGMESDGKRIKDPSQRIKIAVLSPGLHVVDPPKNDRRASGVVLFELAFRDSRNKVWKRKGNGKLRMECAKRPAELYETGSVPDNWTQPRRRSTAAGN